MLFCGQLSLRFKSFTKQTCQKQFFAILYQKTFFDKVHFSCCPYCCSFVIRVRVNCNDSVFINCLMVLVLISVSTGNGCIHKEETTYTSSAIILNLMCNVRLKACVYIIPAHQQNKSLHLLLKNVTVIIYSLTRSQMLFFYRD